MKSLVEVLRQKESELQQIQAEVDALRLALRLVSEEGESYGRSLAATGTSSESRVTEINTGSGALVRSPIMSCSSCMPSMSTTGSAALILSRT